MRSWSRSTSFRTGKGVTRTRLLRARLLSAAALSQGSVPGLENTKTCFSARSIMDEREREREGNNPSKRLPNRHSKKDTRVVRIRVDGCLLFENFLKNTNDRDVETRVRNENLFRYPFVRHTH